MTQLKSVFILLLSFFTIIGVYAQDYELIAEENGIEVYGRIDLLDQGKKKDQYVLSAYATNTSGKEFYSEGPWITIKIVNSKSLIGNVTSITGESSTFSTVDGNIVYRVKAGNKYETSSKFKVSSGLEPALTVSFSNNIADNLSDFRLRVTPQNVVGRWRIENGKDLFKIDYNGVELTIVDGYGDVAKWQLGNDGLYYRVVGFENNDEGDNSSLAYTSSLSLISPEKILYQNSEGISIYFIRVD